MEEVDGLQWGQRWTINLIWSHSVYELFPLLTRTSAIFVSY